jgi:hypothetical protein
VKRQVLAREPVNDGVKVEEVKEDKRKMLKERSYLKNQRETISLHSDNFAPMK